MCVCSVLAPHGCPEPPAPATRLSHHQSQAHDHSRRDASAAVHLSLQSAPIAQAPAPSSGTIPHRSATRPARRFTARRARRHAARAGHRARAPPPDQGCCTTCCRWCSSPACSEHSARVLRCAPAASRLHDADPALHEARAWHAARALRHPFSLLSSLPAHSTEHMQGTQGTCARRAVPAQRCSPHPASRRASACRTQYCAHCSIFVTKRKQKPPHRGHRNPKKILNKTTPKRKGERRARKNILPKFLRQSTSEIIIQTKTPRGVRK